MRDSSRRLSHTLAFQFLLGAMLSIRTSHAVYAQACAPPKPIDIRKVQIYVARRLGHEDSKINIAVGDSLARLRCFTELTISDADSHSTFQLYLSPDRRYVTSELYDLNINPERQRELEDHEIVALLGGAGGKQSGEQDRKKVVVFLDLECPFCRKMDQTLQDLMNDTAIKVQLEYRAFPIESHPWALDAAITGACVQVQNKELFVQFVHAMFVNQAKITTENMRSVVSQWLKDNPSVDQETLDECVASGKGKLLVESDIASAKALNVDAVPTTFINGKRIVGFADQSALKDAILTIADGKKTQESETVPALPKVGKND